MATTKVAEFDHAMATTMIAEFRLPHALLVSYSLVHKPILPAKLLHRGKLGFNKEMCLRAGWVASKGVIYLQSA